MKYKWQIFSKFEIFFYKDCLFFSFPVNEIMREKWHKLVAKERSRRREYFRSEKKMKMTYQQIHARECIVTLYYMILSVQKSHMWVTPCFFLLCRLYIALVTSSKMRAFKYLVLHLYTTILIIFFRSLHLWNKDCCHHHQD